MISMWWIILLVYITVWTHILDKNQENVKDLTLSPMDQHDQNKQITYTSKELKSMGQNFLNNKLIRKVPNFKTIRVIKDLKINARRIRIQKWKKVLLRKQNLNNLKDIPYDGAQPIVLNSKYTFATVNVRSLKTSMNQLLEIIVREDLDFIMVTETWLKDDDASQSWLNAQGLSEIGYNHDSVPRKGRRGGGLLLIYKSNYKAQRVPVEIQYCEAMMWKLSHKHYSTTCLGIYHPPQSSIGQPSDSIFIDHFLDTIPSIISEVKDLIILGDFNIHVNDKSDGDAVIFVDAMESLGFSQHVTNATHISGNTIDLVFSEPDVTSITKCTCTDLLSDHRIVICQTDRGKPTPEKATIEIRKYNDSNITRFAQDLDLSCVLNCKSLEEAVLEYETVLKKCLDDNMPIKSKTVVKRKCVPWYCDDIKQQRQVVRNRERTWLKYNQQHQWEAYKRERNRYRNMINHYKSNFYTKSINDARGDTKRLYQLVNSITTTITPNPMPEDKTDSELSELFADFFLEKIIKIRQLFTNIPLPDLQIRTEVPTFSKFAPMTESEIKAIIAKMKTKSCELDPIPTHLLKDDRVINKLIPIITRITNLSLELGEFSKNWKTAIVRPLLKKQNLPKIEKNYRPVSNLQFVSKVVERAALKQFNDHCLTYKLIPDYQSAYREGYSCETVVIKLHNDILWAMENQEVMACVLLDLSAAFDTVDHDLLLSVLSNRYNIQDSALQWYTSYLRPREFKVCVGKEYSPPKSLSFSVPQGSASGANLFVAYCESLKNTIPSDVGIKGFADDHSLQKSFKANNRQQELSTINTLESAFLSTKQWMDEMRLKLNPDKTEFILFGNQVQLDKTVTKEFKACEDIISCSNNAKVLGTVFDKNMKMVSHVNLKCKTALFNYRKIREIRQYLNRDSCETLVLSLVISHLDYNNSVLIGISDYLLKRFQRIQNMCAKLVLNRKKYDSSTEALKELHWLRIYLRIQFKTLCMTHKCLYSVAPDYLKNLLIRNPGCGRPTRSSSAPGLRLIIPRVKLKTFAARSFSVMAPTLWNSLPQEITLISSLELFKSKVKTILFESY